MRPGPEMSAGMMPTLDCPGLMTLGDDGEYRLKDRPERLACSYTLQAVKPG
jgi:hypothetical protein